MAGPRHALVKGEKKPGLEYVRDMGLHVDMTEHFTMQATITLSSCVYDIVFCCKSMFY